MIGQKGIPAMLGGVERHVEELSAHLVMRGHDVTVFCRPHYAEPTPPKRLGLRRLEAPGTHRGVRLRLLPSIPTKHLDAITHVSLATLAAVFGEFDIFHYHSIGPALMSFFRHSGGGGLWLPCTRSTGSGRSGGPGRARP